MNKTLKRLIAFVLVLTLSLSAFAGAFSVFAEDTTVAEDIDEEYSKTTFLELIVRFWQSVGAFFKYIFYDVFLGKPAPEIPPVPNSRYF